MGSAERGHGILRLYAGLKTAILPLSWAWNGHYRSPKGHRTPRLGGSVLGPSRQRLGGKESEGRACERTVVEGTLKQRLLALFGRALYAHVVLLVIGDGVERAPLRITHVVKVGCAVRLAHDSFKARFVRAYHAVGRERIGRVGRGQDGLNKSFHLRARERCREQTLGRDLELLLAREHFANQFARFADALRKQTVVTIRFVDFVRARIDGAKLIEAKEPHCHVPVAHGTFAVVREHRQNVVVDTLASDGEGLGCCGLHPDARASVEFTSAFEGHLTILREHVEDAERFEVWAALVTRANRAECCVRVFTNDAEQVVGSLKDARCFSVLVYSRRNTREQRTLYDVPSESVLC